MQGAAADVGTEARVPAERGIAHVESEARITTWIQMAKRSPFLWPVEGNGSFDFGLCNVSVSQCFNCKKVSIWVHDRLEYPRAGGAPPAYPDLADDIRRDYDEASSILDESPRGAAALMRLAIQKLCSRFVIPVTPGYPALRHA